MCACPSGGQKRRETGGFIYRTAFSRAPGGCGVLEPIRAPRLGLRLAVARRVARLACQACPGGSKPLPCPTSRPHLAICHLVARLTPSELCQTVTQGERTQLQLTPRPSRLMPHPTPHPSRTLLTPIYPRRTTTTTIRLVCAGARGVNQTIPGRRVSVPGTRMSTDPWLGQKGCLKFRARPGAIFPLKI